MSAIPSWAVPGAKVVCITPRFFPRNWWKLHLWFTRDPKFGEVCMIERVRIGHRGAYLVLVGFGNPRRCYNANRFRPLVPTKTEAEDVALFVKHLSPPVSATPPERIERVDAA